MGFRSHRSARRNLSSPSRWQSCSFAVQRYPPNPLNCALANSKWLIWRLRRLRFRRKGRARSHHQKKYKQPLLPPESRTAGMKAREITCRTSVFRFARALEAAKETGERTSWRCPKQRSGCCRAFRAAPSCRRCNTLLGASDEICSSRTARRRTGMQVLRSLLSKGSCGTRALTSSR